ncbi:MAG: hypothetical protein J6G98_02825 [Bacilli bacterium]|nr:hypothetical protein [Bacilli bacterium]
MKIKFDNNKYIIYLNKLQTSVFENINDLEDYFINLLSQIKNKYNIDMNGLYNLNIYLDDYYGSIMELINIDSFEYYLTREVDLNIKIIKSSFLYEIDNFNFDKNKFDYFLNDKKIYLKIKNDISDKDMYILLENSNLIYDTEKLILSSKKI